jgi:hypothetical protein
VFRLTGDAELDRGRAALDPGTLLSSNVGGATICLVALDAGRVPGFGAEMRRLAAAGIVTRVEAEPHL